MMKKPNLGRTGKCAHKDDEQGMILINVLIIVMLATAILAVMIAGDDTDVELNLRLRNAAEARAIAAGAELSAVAALRRDLARGDDSDSQKDSWATIGDDATAIDGGRFTFAVSDAQALFNINNLLRSDTLTRGNFAAMVAAVDLPPEFTDRIAELVRATGGIRGLADLQAAGLTLPEIQRLAAFTTVLPEPTDVNLNTAPEELVAIMLNNPGKARVLVAAREAGGGRGGGMTRADMASAGVFPPPGSGVTSSYFWTRSLVAIGGDSHRLTSLLYRRTRGGGPQVLILKRWRGAAPLQVPPLPNGP